MVIRVLERQFDRGPLACAQAELGSRAETKQPARSFSAPFDYGLVMQEVTALTAARAHIRRAEKTFLGVNCQTPRLRRPNLEFLADHTR
jgi:hypothetical protein